jgi:hypothetical protein
VSTVTAVLMTRNHNLWQPLIKNHLAIFYILCDQIELLSLSKFNYD